MKNYTKALSIFTFLCMIVCFFAIRSAQATQYTAASNPLNGFISAGDNLTGSFGSEYFSNNYTISSGTVRYSFSDNSDGLIDNGSSQYNSGSFPNYYHHTNYSYYNPYESVQVQTGETVYGGNTSYYSFGYSGGSYTTSQLVWRSYWVQDGCTYFGGCYGHYEYYQATEYHTYTSSYGISGYSGSFFVDQILDETALGAIRSTGTLPFLLTGTSGDLNFTGAQLTFDAEPVPAAPVPIPPTLLLLAPGLAGLALARKRPKN